MKIVHTADVHVRDDHEETVEALKKVVKLADSEGAKLLTIGGDIFDTADDAEKSRPELREIFKNNDFPIIGIPGNHDEDVYETTKNFGEDIEILTDEPFETREVEGVEVIGVPFVSSMTDELFSALKEKSDDTKTQILLLHCTLDIGFGSGASGEEDKERYFPVTRNTLSELGYDYILAGHIHSGFREVPLDNGGSFIYPGSPVSHSTKEKGKRQAAVLDTEKGSVKPLELDTFYYDSFEKEVTPGSEDDIFNDLEAWIEKREDDNCKLEVELTGFTEMSENEFSEKIGSLIGGADLINETRSAESIIQHPLYQRFKERIDETENPERTRRMVIETLSELMAKKKVSMQ